MKHFLVIILLVGLISCETKTNVSPQQEWRLVYHNDAEGNALYGSKETLMDAVRKGLPVRIGFGFRSSRDTTRSVEHVADAKFLTIMDNGEVFAQIDPIIGQRPVRDGDTLKIRFRNSNKWVKIAGTNGYSTALMIDYLNDSLVNPGRDGRAGTLWYVYTSGSISSEEKSEPIWD